MNPGRRTYRAESGARIVATGRDSFTLIPAWCQHIGMALSRADAARYLREARRMGLRVTRELSK